ncbi:hypothetical protein [Paraburkholderia sp. 40]|uniref:hypothetical protein n=1 Tax=Paraburkholderia sp. 40 TaxID=2991059 RepID=UPI003D206B9F
MEELSVALAIAINLNVGAALAHSVRNLDGFSKTLSEADNLQRRFRSRRWHRRLPSPLISTA